MEPSEQLPPLIVTALLDDDTQEEFNRLRRLHFPPERNYLDAHVTLFHALPGEHHHEVTNALDEITKRGPIEATVSRLISLGGGVGFRIEASELLGLRRDLAAKWEGLLTPQDGQKGELHVTVQNKVPSEVAKQLFAELSTSFERHATSCRGLALWKYMGGPWEHDRDFPFAEDPNE